MEQITVIYRMCAKENGKARPQSWDKRTLTELCLHSFVEAFREVHPFVIFILDDCPEYKEFVPFVPFEKQIIETSLGNLNTFRKQLEIAHGLQGKVYFAEDDYLYLPNIGKKILTASDAFHFFTPYDHRGHYDQPWVEIPQKVALINDHHYKTAVSTTLTFLTKADYIRDNFDLFVEHGINDHLIFTKLLEKGYTLGCPIPAFATHMEKEFLSPGINWERVWQKYL